MSNTDVLRALVTQRLTAAAEDIFLLFERTIAEYEVELLRLRDRGDRGDTGDRQRPRPGPGQGGPEAPRADEEPHTAGVQLVSVSDEEPAHIKEDPELCIKQEPLFSVVCVKNEEDEEESVLHQGQTEEDSEAPEGAGHSSEPLPHSHSDSEGHSSDDSRGLATGKQHDTAANAEYVVKPHRCPECGKRFLRKDHLQGHMIIHTGERPHKCSYCDKTFIRQNHLKTHLRNHTGERPYSCPFCNRGFTTKALLTPHMRIHTGDRPFRCTECDKGFIQRSHLKAHVKTHSREKTFTCLICRQVFYERGDLMVHSRLVHPE